MLLAEELALVAIKPGSGRHEIGTGRQLNACLAGLLVAELLLDGTVDPAARDAIVTRRRAAAGGDGPIEARTALVLSMTGPAQVLEVVAPERSSRKHANRIDHALDGSELEPVGKVVRRLIQEAAAVAATVAIGGSAAATSG